MDNQSASPKPDAEIEVKATPQELLRDLRSGRTDAAYELLGRQASIKAWREALDFLTEAPKTADLELAAHRGLRRPPQVVMSLLALAEAAAAPQAALVAHATSRLRAEPELVSRAEVVRTAILEKQDLELALAGDDGLSSLYLILAHDLAGQAELAERIRGEESSFDLVSRALAAEYQRLLELGRTVRWTSGSYRYFLRHSLADFALMADLQGRTGERAYRLLQQHVENPEENEELLAHLPVSTRRRFLNWALERENASQHPARTRFVLNIAPRYSEEIDRAAVVKAAEVADVEVAVDALITAIALAPDRADVDHEIARRVDSLDEPAAIRLVRAVVELEPRRLRLDLIATSRRHVIVEGAATRASEVIEQASALIPGISDIDRAEWLVVLAEEIGDKYAIPPAAFEKIAIEISNRAAAEARWGHTFESSLMKPRLRGASWSILPALSSDRHANLYRNLVAHAEREESEVRTNELLHLVPNPDAGLIDVITEKLLDGTVSIDSIANAAEPVKTLLAANAHQLMVAMEQELKRAERLIDQGQPVAEKELREGLRPIVEHAINRAEGNERLQNDYRRLLPTDADPPAASKAQLPLEVPPSAYDELGGLNAQTQTNDGALRIELAPAHDEHQRAEWRYLALLDQRLATGEEAAADWELVLAAYVDALGRRGDVVRLVSDLFERGPALKLVVGLSPSTRTRLIQTAMVYGLAVKNEWYEDSALGSWLRTIVPSESSLSSDIEAGQADSVDLLRRARRLAAELDLVSSSTKRLEHDAKLSFLAQSKQAFDDLELAVDGYVQLWNALSVLGIAQVAPLGTVVESEHLDPARYEIVGEGGSDQYIVRSAGTVIDDEVVVKALVEGLAT